MKRLAIIGLFIFTLLTEGVASDSLNIRIRIEGLSSLRLVDATFYTDKSKKKQIHEIQNAPFQYIDKNIESALTDYHLRSHLWMRLVLNNMKPDILKCYLHYGNTERFNMYHVTNGKMYEYKNGFLVSLYQRPMLEMSFAPSAYDTIYVSFRNYIYPLGEFTWVFGSDFGISDAENRFVDANNRWLIFQVIYLSIMIFQIIYHFSQYFFLKRPEYLYYSLFLLAATIFFGLYFIEVKNQTFSHRFESTMTIYIFKSLIILYIWAYFKFQKYFLDFPLDVPEINTIFKNLSQIPLRIVALDIVLMLLRIPAYWEIGIFILASGVLIYYAVKSNITLVKYRSLDNVLIKGISLTMNVIALITVYEVISANPFFDLGIGFLMFQTGSMIETLGFSMALSQKSLRIEKDLSRLQLEKERQQEEFQRRLAELEMQALRAQVNPHFIFNCLNSITLMVEKRDNERAETYLQKFSKLMRYVLDNARSKTVTLKQDMDALELYIQLERSRYGNRFNYKIEIDKNIPISTLQIPPLLVQPYVENAIWHGLLKRENEGGMLWVRLKKQDDYLIIEVEDNGIGREKAMALKSKSAATHRSYGMALTAERLRILREIAQTDAKVDVIDLNGEGNQSGTLVRLSLQEVSLN
jgi:sensor histidine kinase YesM